MVLASIAAAVSLPAVAAGWYLAPLSARWRTQRRLRALCASTRSLVLTYDDGPSEELTPRLLDLLRSHGARATFFLLGHRAVENPSIVGRIVEHGHEVACHTHKHLNAWHGWPWRSVTDMNAGYRALSRWVPADGMFRPPHGKMTLLTWAALRRRRAPVGWWTINGGDVNEQLPHPNSAVEQAEQSTGGVVLLHDFDRGRERGEFVLKSTELLLDAAQQHGWTVRTLGELDGEGRKEGLKHAA